MLGKREPEIYGAETLGEVNTRIGSLAKELGVEVEYFQSNSEGEIVSKIQDAMKEYEGIVMNPGAYTHTSVAIRDAILSSGLTVVEVHISNLHKREEFRHKSYVSGVALGVVSGFGIDSYFLGLRGLVSHLNK
jgi:3-dehydroquinate dehydratase-2